MTTNSDFLPADYETPKSEGQYMKFKDGENKFRILSKPIIGWLDWKDKKPLRFEMKNKPARPINPDQSIKHFWAFPVWDYADGKVKILEITQSTIQSAIQSLSKDEDWGSPFEYDLKVIRKGEKLDTEYTIQPSPKKPVPVEATNALLTIHINMDALWTGDDPFAGNGTSNGNGTPPAKAEKLELKKMVGNDFTADWSNIMKKIGEGSITMEKIKEHYQMSPEVEEELKSAFLPF